MRAPSLAFKAPDQISQEIVQGEKVPEQITQSSSSPVRIPRGVPLLKIKLAEELQCVTGVYVRRWYIETRWASIRLHHWLHSDDARAMHDHTWWFVTLILKGSYADINPTGEELMTPGKFAFRPALHRHIVQVSPGGCWSLLITGPKIRRFGFWLHGRKFIRSTRYFLRFGPHVCD
jgi:hypothetical protein